MRQSSTLVDGLRPIGLAELEATAALLERMDRKYVLEVETLGRLLEALRDSHAALEIDGIREFEYRTTYYDTAGLVTYRDHLQRRRRRFKARAREYLDSGDCAFEVKVKGARGRTVKHRMGYDPGLAESLTEPALTFLLECLKRSYGGGLDEHLHPSLTMTYRRLTIVAPTLAERLTCDFALEYSAPDGTRGRMADGIAIVESKSIRGAARADDVLKALGARPERNCSKYCLGIGLTHPGVKSNPFRHLLRRHFTALPAAVAVAVAVLAVALPAAAPPAAEAAGDRVATRLPLVSITSPRTIRDEPKVAARMRVIDRPGRRLNRPRDRARAYDGRIGIEHRGQISQVWAKKSYALETRTRQGGDREVRLLGLPRDADWVLHASHADRSLLRNVLAFATARGLGGYAPRTRHVELLLDGRYRGVYVLMEPLELNDRRIRERKKTMLLELTTEAKLDRGDEIVTGPATRSPVRIADAGDKVSGKERRRAQAAIDGFETVLYGPEAADPVRGWRRWLDERSAVDFMLVQELFRNQDAFFSSTHMRLGPSGPLRLGPIWDLDVSAGNAAEVGQLGPEGWRSVDRPWGGPLMRDPGFMRSLAARWRAVRRDGLAEFLQRSLEQQSGSLAAPAARNFRTWNVLARPVNSLHPARASYAEEITALQDWLTLRVAWMDQALAAEAT